MNCRLGFQLWECPVLSYLHNIKETLSILSINQSVVENTVHFVNPQTNKLPAICSTYSRKKKNTL
jgi:hypothetical protein